MTPAALSAGDYWLRSFEPGDAAAFAGAVRESMETVGRWMSWAHAAYTEAEALDWFAACSASRAAGSAHEYGVFRADDHGFVGGVGLNQFNTANNFCNLGYWTRASAQRHGAAGAAVAALSRYAFDVLQLQRIEIVVAAGNDASRRVAERSGAVPEGLARRRLRLHGRAVDAHMFALINT